MGEGTGELVLYTSRFGEMTGTDDNGTEVVLSAIPLPLATHGSFDGMVKRARMSEKRRDILEQDAWFGKIRNIPDDAFDFGKRRAGLGHDGGRSVVETLG